MYTVSSKNEAKEYLCEKLDEIAATISLEKMHNKTAWARANFDYGRNILLLAEIDTLFCSDNLYEESIEAFKNAMYFYQTNQEWVNYCATALALSRSWRYYASRKGDQRGIAYLKKAHKLLKHLNLNLQTEDLYIQQVMIKCEQANLMRSFMQLSPRNTHILYLKRAIKLYEKALKLLKEKEDYNNWQHILSLVANLYSELSILQEEKQARFSIKKAIAIFESILQSNKLDINEHNGDLHYKNLLAELELAFLYSNLAHNSNNINYTNSALKYIQKLENTTGIDFSPEIILRLSLDKADLTYKYALHQKDKISGLKQTAALYKSNSKKVKIADYEYKKLSEIFNELAKLTYHPKEKTSYLKEAIYFYRQTLPYVTENKNLILIYKKIAIKEAELANLNNDPKAYRPSLLFLYKALKLTPINSISYYNITLKIVSILVALAKQNSPLKIYYKTALHHLNRVEKIEPFAKQYKKLSQDLNKLFNRNNFKYLTKKILGIKF